jgi:predicted PurR-regulated permease PerM
MRIAIALTNERINSTRTVAVVVWALFIVALGGIGWVVNQAADVIQSVDAKLDNVHTQQRADSAKGWQIADGLEKSVEDNKDNIKDLQKLHRIRSEKE